MGAHTSGIGQSIGISPPSVGCLLDHFNKVLIHDDWSGNDVNEIYSKLSRTPYISSVLSTATHAHRFPHWCVFIRKQKKKKCRHHQLNRNHQIDLSHKLPSNECEINALLFRIIFFLLLFCFECVWISFKHSKAE